MTTEYRRDIEGLRGLAVLAVVLFHAFPTHVPGGFVGVDVFFVISGFLITRLLAAELEGSGRLDLVAFWARRIRRILPAATLVLVAVAAMALVLPAVDARDLGRHLIAAGLFYYNWRQIRSSVDYLAADDHDNPLLHYWSLAVEEQFYIVWPLSLALIFFALRRSGDHRRLLWIVAVVAVLWLASFVYSVALSEANRAAAFFDTGSRAWQLLSGAIVALSPPRTLPRMTLPRIGSLYTGAAVLAVLVVLGACRLVSAELPYPGWTAAAPTLATALLIHFGAARANPVAQLLSFAPLRAIGRNSFAWYLWHWPLIVLARSRMGEQFWPEFVALIASFALAMLSTRFVEEPLRRQTTLVRSMPATYAMGAALVALSLALGLGLKMFGPDQVEVAPGRWMSGEAIYRDRPVIYHDDCLLGFNEIAQPVCAYGARDATRTIVLFGDSHAGNWFGALDAAAAAAGLRLLVRIKASCRPVEAEQTVVEGRSTRPYHECTTWRGRVLAELKALGPVLIVVSSARHTLAAAAELRLLEQLAAVAPTLVMRDTPWFPESTVTCLKRTMAADKCSWPLRALLSRDAYPKTDMRLLPPNATVVNLNNRICPGERCRSVQDGIPVMFDAHHLTASFSRTLSDEFASLIAQYARK